MVQIKCPFCEGSFVFGTRPFVLGEKTYHIADCFCDNCGIHPPGGKESTSTTGAIISAQNVAKRWIAHLEHEKEEARAAAYSRGYDDCAARVFGDLRRNVPAWKIEKYLEPLAK